MESQTLEARLTSSADRITQLQEAIETEMERRDGMVIEARGEGWAWKRIAVAARLSVTRCCVIVADG